MSDMPENIWAYEVDVFQQGKGFGNWYDQDVSGTDECVKYTRTDISEARIQELEGYIQRLEDELSAAFKLVENISGLSRKKVIINQMPQENMKGSE